MNLRRAAAGLVIVTLVGSGAYVFVYLYRWEWHRALTAGIFFLASQAALVLFVLLDRLSDVTARLERVERGVTALRAGQGAGPGSSEGSPRVEAGLARIEASRPGPRDPFAWLRPDRGDLGVFVPVLLGAGVVVSAVAWCVERVARLTAGPVLERRLARQLAPLLLDDAGLVPRRRGGPGDPGDLGPGPRP